MLWKVHITHTHRKKKNIKNQRIQTKSSFDYSYFRHINTHWIQIYYIIYWRALFTNQRVAKSILVFFFFISFIHWICIEEIFLCTNTLIFYIIFDIYYDGIDSCSNIVYTVYLYIEIARVRERKENEERAFYPKNFVPFE